MFLRRAPFTVLFKMSCVMFAQETNLERDPCQTGGCSFGSWIQISFMVKYKPGLCVSVFKDLSLSERLSPRFRSAVRFKPGGVRPPRRLLFLRPVLLPRLWPQLVS